jgi:hypothetical protein
MTPCVADVTVHDGDPISMHSSRSLEKIYWAKLLSPDCYPRGSSMLNCPLSDIASHAIEPSLPDFRGHARGAMLPNRGATQRRTEGREAHPLHPRVRLLMNNHTCIFHIITAFGPLHIIHHHKDCIRTFSPPLKPHKNVSQICLDQRILTSRKAKYYELVLYPRQLRQTDFVECFGSAVYKVATLRSSLLA